MITCRRLLLTRLLRFTAAVTLTFVTGGCSVVALAPPQPADAKATTAGIQAADQARAATRQIGEQQREQDRRVQQLQPSAPPGRL